MSLRELLLRRLSLVQGPPSKGKAHIGVVVVETLLQNKSLRTSGADAAFGHVTDAGIPVAVPAVVVEDESVDAASVVADAAASDASDTADAHHAKQTDEPTLVPENLVDEPAAFSAGCENTDAGLGLDAPRPCRAVADPELATERECLVTTRAPPTPEAVSCSSSRPDQESPLASAVAAAKRVSERVSLLDAWDALSEAAENELPSTLEGDLLELEPVAGPKIERARAAGSTCLDLSSRSMESGAVDDAVADLFGGEAAKTAARPATPRHELLHGTFCSAGHRAGSDTYAPSATAAATPEPEGSVTASGTEGIDAFADAVFGTGPDVRAGTNPDSEVVFEDVFVHDLVSERRGARTRGWSAEQQLDARRVRAEGDDTASYHVHVGAGSERGSGGLRGGTTTAAPNDKVGKAHKPRWGVGTSSAVGKSFFGVRRNAERASGDGGIPTRRHWRGSRSETDIFHRADRYSTMESGVFAGRARHTPSERSSPGPNDTVGGRGGRADGCQDDNYASDLRCDNADDVERPSSDAVGTGLAGSTACESARCLQKSSSSPGLPGRGAESGWKQKVSKRNPRRAFFFNAATGKKVWKLEHLAKRGGHMPRSTAGSTIGGSRSHKPAGQSRIAVRPHIHNGSLATTRCSSESSLHPQPNKSRRTRPLEKAEKAVAKDRKQHKPQKAHNDSAEKAVARDKKRHKAHTAHSDLAEEAVVRDKKRHKAHKAHNDLAEEAVVRDKKRHKSHKAYDDLAEEAVVRDKKRHKARKAYDDSAEEAVVRDKKRHKARKAHSDSAAPPADAELTRSATRPIPASAGCAPTSKGSRGGEQAADPWRECFSARHQRPFYMHRLTKERSWYRP